MLGFVIAGMIASSSMANVFPYIQTHYFDLRPLVPVTKGYAFFVDSGMFSGSENIEVFAPSGVLLPDIHKPSRVLHAYDSRGSWYQNDAERVMSATSGELSEGAYSFRIVMSNGSLFETSIWYQPNNFLGLATDIKAYFTPNGLVVFSWNAPLGAESYLVGIIPENSTDPLRDIRIISSREHHSNVFYLKSELLPPGNFFIAIRANRHRPQGFIGYESESWALSAKSYQWPLR